MATATAVATTVVSEAAAVDSNDNDNKDKDKNGTTRTPAVELMDAALRSLRDPSNGYDQRYGRPALRAYRSFVYPKQQKQQTRNSSNNSNSNRADAAGPERTRSNGDGMDSDNNNNNNNNNNNVDSDVRRDPIQLEAAARRTAHQIDFLVKRHTSKRLEAIRNHDPETPGGGNGNGNGNGNDSTGTIFPITLVLDNLRGSFNVGSIFRTSEACGVKEILTCGITPHPNGSGAEKVAKSALGADLLVPSRHFDTTRQALLDATANNNNNNNNKDAVPPPLVVALETTAASQLYTGFDYRPYYNTSGGAGSSNDDDDDNDNDAATSNGRGIVLILGNEVTGVDAELMAHLLPPSGSENENDGDNGDDATKTTAAAAGLVDAIVELPTYGKKNSLNVAAVAPVILYEILRQWEEEDA